MFGKSSGKQSPRPETPPVPSARPERRKEQSLLQTGVTLRGEMQVDGDLRVEGKILADLKVRGTLLVGGPAEVEGELLGQNVVVHGHVSGTVRAEEQIRLAEGARVRGDLYCKSLVIEEGVIFEGRSHMGESRAPKSQMGKAPDQAARQATGGAAASAGSPPGNRPLATQGTGAPRDTGKKPYQTAN